MSHHAGADKQMLEEIKPIVWKRLHNHINCCGGNTFDSLNSLVLQFRTSRVGSSLTGLYRCSRPEPSACIIANDLTAKSSQWFWAPFLQNLLLSTNYLPPLQLISIFNIVIHIMGLITILNESRSQIWLFVGWLSITILLLIPVWFHVEEF